MGSTGSRCATEGFMMQTLVNFGSAIKADDSGRVRGYLVRFGGQDLEGD